MDENGNYKVVYGLKLDQIPKGDIKVMINAHGELGKDGESNTFISLEVQ
jgi:hypothetical protein